MKVKIKFELLKMRLHLFENDEAMNYQSISVRGRFNIFFMIMDTKTCHTNRLKFVILYLKIISPHMFGFILVKFDEEKRATIETNCTHIRDITSMILFEQKFYSDSSCSYFNWYFVQFVNIINWKIMIYQKFSFWFFSQICHFNSVKYTFTGNIFDRCWFWHPHLSLW